ncbi:unnamed protein product [Gulo gulo]|uniref:Uncharacterized protein n=1 Tax=Gulo gulo TaxID=48420 RepID=A0A9X9M868_GULGU|nr:unnamed protein product [Gulo gulo]
MFTYTMTLGGNHVPKRLYSSRRLKRSSAQPETVTSPQSVLFFAFMLFLLSDAEMF